jgi:hypothetical protein
VTAGCGGRGRIASAVGFVAHHELEGVFVSGEIVRRLGRREWRVRGPPVAWVHQVWGGGPGSCVEHGGFAGPDAVEAPVGDGHFEDSTSSAGSCSSMKASRMASRDDGMFGAPDWWNGSFESRPH